MDTTLPTTPPVIKQGFWAKLFFRKPKPASPKLHTYIIPKEHREKFAKLYDLARENGNYENRLLLWTFIEEITGEAAAIEKDKDNPNEFKRVNEQVSIFWFNHCTPCLKMVEKSRPKGWDELLSD
jgi:hypothetical protein